MNIAVRQLKESRHSTLNLRDAMRLSAGAVSVVTAGIGHERTGLTVTTATSLSIDPPTMIVCINRDSSSWPAIESHRHFCVNYLAQDQADIADRFAGRSGEKGVERYAEAEWTTLATGASALVDSIASIDCIVDDFIIRHSHAVIIGRVTALTVNGGLPLVYGRGRYGVFQSL
jgi:3-hydroxy-9,10-secoandrosta-1,3,5(10)-triene-9,17-dione monooxygenase reductase component